MAACNNQSMESEVLPRVTTPLCVEDIAQFSSCLLCNNALIVTK